ncbi:MAG: type II toxin-antitoxin system RelE/ParE family toxin [Clostridia bacterium]|nr:type II toxin-antitoxin system RelE/ParE family toxin [Clostridia bacterium]
MITIEQIILLQPAKIDLINIKNYIAKDSLYFSKKTISKIQDRINQLSLFPYMGRYVPEFNSKTIREIIYKSYRIIYYIDSKNIYILKILHHSQNIINFKSELFQK